MPRFPHVHVHIDCLVAAYQGQFETAQAEAESPPAWPCAGVKREPGTRSGVPSVGKKARRKCRQKKVVQWWTRKWPSNSGEEAPALAEDGGERSWRRSSAARRDPPRTQRRRQGLWSRLTTSLKCEWANEELIVFVNVRKSA